MLAQDDTSARQPEKVDDGPIIYVAYQRGNHFEDAMQLYPRCHKVHTSPRSQLRDMSRIAYCK